MRLPAVSRNKALHAGPEARAPRDVAEAALLDRGDDPAAVLGALERRGRLVRGHRGGVALESDALDDRGLAVVALRGLGGTVVATELREDVLAEVVTDRRGILVALGHDAADRGFVRGGLLVDELALILVADRHVHGLLVVLVAGVGDRAVVGL